MNRLYQMSCMIKSVKKFFSYENINHPHKRRIRKSDLKAGTGYTIKKYPAIVISAAERWLTGEFK